MDNVHIILYEQFINPDHELYLSPNEFMIYSYLYLQRKYYKQIATTCIELIHQDLPRFKSTRESDNKKYIKSVLLTLRNKKLIDFAVDDPKYTTILHITFNRMNDTKYDYIPASVYEKTSDPRELLVLCVVEARCSHNRKEGCVMSFNDWAKILGCSFRTAVNVINRMIAKGLIWKQSGKYVGSKQDRNAYFNYDVDAKEENGQQPKGKPNEDQTVNHHAENSDSPLVEKGKNWFIDRSELTVDDFEAYIHIKNKKEEDRTPGEKALFEAANNRSKRLQSSPKGRKFYNDMMDKAMRKINKENNKRLKEDNSNLMIDMSKEYKYQKRNDDIDIFDLDVERFLESDLQ